MVVLAYREQACCHAWDPSRLQLKSAASNVLLCSRQR